MLDSWVLDGNYTRTIPIKWKQVDTIIWIDFSFTRTLFQALKRAISRILTKEELWPDTNNRESFKKLFSKDSIILWTLKNYHKNKIKYSLLNKNPEYQAIDIIRLRSPKECQNYLKPIPT
ncbi:MAG: adenylate kinase [Xanthomonadales bacterium]|nr:adenylate kinase [Xanthomonadales bacterium]